MKTLKTKLITALMTIATSPVGLFFASRAYAAGGPYSPYEPYIPEPTGFAPRGILTVIGIVLYILGLAAIAYAKFFKNIVEESK